MYAHSEAAEGTRRQTAYSFFNGERFHTGEHIFLSNVLFLVDSMNQPNAALLSVLSPWYESLKDPAEAQRRVLLNLARTYAETDYGRGHSASDVRDMAGYRQRFPAIDYPELRGHLEEVKKGNYRAFLSEPPLCWVMTRGSTGTAKVLPATKTHLEQILSCGARALANYVARTRDAEISAGKFLNLGLPSRVHKIDMDGQSRSYGYSSGTYARLHPTFGGTSLVPSQEEIDALGPGIAREDWENRFEMAYEKASAERVTAAIGVAPVILSFARFVKRRHGKSPKDLWKIRALFCTSVRKIQFRYAPNLRKYYGEVPVVEIYSATEGVFAQQIDDLPYVTPNYDKYLFEVETGRGLKMLHELKRGEWGRLIVSSCMFPRYDIGDMIESAGKNYFRVFGRAKTLHILEHRLHRLLFGWAL